MVSWLSFSLPDCLFTFLSVCMSVCVSAFPSGYPSVHLIVCVLSYLVMFIIVSVLYTVFLLCILHYAFDEDGPLLDFCSINNVKAL